MTPASLSSWTAAHARTFYGLALRTAWSRRGLAWSVHDEIVRIDPDVRHLVPQAGEPAIFRFLKKAIAPGDVVLDVGAFLGIYAILAARRTGAGGRVIAFEPTPRSAATIRRHLHYNRPESERVTLVEAAVSDRRGGGLLHEYRQAYVNGLVPAVDVHGPSATREVDVMTIDDVCTEMGVVPSFIRMDVQGAEAHVLRGAAATIRAAGWRLTIVAEMHPQCWPSFALTQSGVEATIRDLGLVAAPLVPGDTLFARDAHAVLVPAGGART